MLMLPTEPIACKYHGPEDRRSTINKIEVDTKHIRMSSLQGVQHLFAQQNEYFRSTAEWGLGASPSPRGFGHVISLSLQPHRRQGATTCPILQIGALRLGEAYLDQRHTTCKRQGPGRIRLVPTLNTGFPGCPPSNSILGRVSPGAPAPGRLSLSKDDTHAHLRIATIFVTMYSHSAMSPFAGGDESVL